MKTKYTALLVGLVTSLNAADTPLDKGFDWTAIPNITPSLLNQIIDQAQVRTNRGLVYVTNGIPSPMLTYSNHIWLDRSVDPPSMKVFSITGVWTNAVAAASSIGTDQLQNNSVTAAKIAAGAVTAGKLGAASVGSAELQDFSVLENHIADAQITPAKLMANVIEPGKIAASSVFGSNIVAGTVASNNIGATVVYDYHLANNSVSSNKYAASSIFWSKLNASLQDLFKVSRAYFSGEGINDGNYTNHTFDYNLSFLGQVTASATSNSTGNFTVNFSPNAVSTNYSVVLQPDWDVRTAIVTNKALTGFRVIFLNVAGNLATPHGFSAHVYGTAK